MAPKRRTGDVLPRGAYNPMHPPPDQQTVGSPQALTPLAGLDVELPRSPVRAAAARHSQEATQPAPSAPSPMQQGTPPRLSQRQTQPMELTPTPTKDKGTTVKTSTRHSQENTQPAPPQLAELYDQQWERHNQEEEELTAESLAHLQQIGDGLPTVTSMDYQPQVLVTEASAQYQQTGECRVAHFAETAQLTHPISSSDEAAMQPNPATSRPDTHDIATPRRRIGGRCRKWVVSTQANSKRTCAACTMCHNQFSPGEPRLQQWSNRVAA